MPPEGSNTELKRLIRENNELIKENNRLIKRLNKYAFVGVVLRVIWYALLIGLPFVLYFYVLEPYFALFGSSYETFTEGLNELPGLKGIDLLLEATMEHNK